MSLWLKFKMDIRGVSPYKQLIKKIEYMDFLLEPINIEKKNYELWNKEIFEELGGELFSKSDKKEIILDRLFKEANFDKFILKTNGIMFYGRKEIPISITLYNSSKYRKIYGDLQIDFPSYSFENLFLSEPNFKELLLKNIIRKKPHFEITSCVVGHSPDSLHDIRERVYTYHSKIRYFVEDFFTTLKIWSEQIKSKEITTTKTKLNYKYYFTQFDTDYLSRKIEKETAFMAYCKKKAGKLGANISSGSITIESPDSSIFNELFIEIKDDFDKIKNIWFTDYKLKQALKNWFTGQQELDID